MAIRGGGSYQSYEDYNVRLADVEMATQSNGDKIVSHEKICAERYDNINDSIESINTTIRWAATALIIGMAGILLKLLLPGA